MNTKPEDIIKQMAANELLVSGLYKLYSEEFPRLREFWLEISEDEIEHAQILNKYLQELENGKVFINNDRFRIEPIINFNKYIQKCIHALATEKITLLDALVTAQDLENSMLERSFFKVYESDSVSLRNAFEKLSSSTSSHASKVREMLDKVKKREKRIAL